MRRLLHNLQHFLFSYPNWRPSYALINLIKETLTLILHLRGILQYIMLKNKKSLKLNLGCGSNIKKTWLNIDLLINNNVISLDLRRRFPFAKDSCSYVYTEHFLEHLAHPEQSMFFLRECYRIMQKGGKINICVPDTEPFMTSYGKGIKKMRIS
jgi:SAM-dependent methyltransferase